MSIMNSIIERFEVEKAFKNKIALTFTSFLKKHCVLKSFKQKKKEKKKWINCFRDYRHLISLLVYLQLIGLVSLISTFSSL